MLHGPRMPVRGLQQRFTGPGYPGMPPHQSTMGPFGQRPFIQSRSYNQPMGRSIRGKQGGGLLAKLLGNKREGPAGMQGFLTPGSSERGAAASGGILKTLTDPSALNGFLTNTQSILKTAQQIGPVIQQYGPIVRNLPSMWRLYKGLKDIPDADEQTQKAESTQKDESRKEKQSDEYAQSVTKEKKLESKGVSSPKLFF